jgi:peptide/nickel transport system permease protein
MAAYILRRLIAIPPLLFGVTLVTFALVHLLPGSPVDDLRLSTPGLTPEGAKSIERTLGLDRPLVQQYTSWLGQLVRGDLGISMKSYRPVTSLIRQRIGNTLLLGGTALLVALLIAVPIGILAALRPNSLFDHVTTIGSSLGFALPSFWVGLLLILAFAVQANAWHLPALPSGGIRTIPGGGDLPDRVRHLILPVITLAIGQISGWARYVRGQMLEALNEDYVRTARGKGLKESVVVWRHAFRNSLLPLVTLIGLSIPELLGGTAIVEAIFSWPGIGQLSVQAATGHDYTLMMGLTVFLALLTMISSLITDLIYLLVDPRIRLAS